MSNPAPILSQSLRLAMLMRTTSSLVHNIFVEQTTYTGYLYSSNLRRFGVIYWIRVGAIPLQSSIWKGFPLDTPPSSRYLLYTVPVAAVLTVLTLANNTRERRLILSRCSVLSGSLPSSSTNRSITPRRAQSFSINHKDTEFKALIVVSFFFILSIHSFYFFNPPPPLFPHHLVYISISTMLSTVMHQYSPAFSPLGPSSSMDHGMNLRASCKPRHHPYDTQRMSSSLGVCQVNSNTPNGNGTPGPIRRRISRACDQCNQLRTKCDGKQPCQHCIGIIHSLIYSSNFGS